MSDFFVGEIQIFAFGFPPKGWALCNGQLMSIQQNTALFSLLGTVYGGDGMRTFALPDLRSKLAVGQGNAPGLTPRSQGQTFGHESIALLDSQNPTHTHPLNVISNPTLSNNTDVPGPTQVLAQTSSSITQGSCNLYVSDAKPAVAMSPAAVSTVGGSPHTNLMPLLALNFCIALTGIFPSRN